MQAMIINVDRKNRSINLSVKAKDIGEDRGDEAVAHRAGRRQRRRHQPSAPCCAKLDKKDGNPQQ